MYTKAIVPSLLLVASVNAAALPYVKRAPQWADPAMNDIMSGPPHPAGKYGAQIQEMIQNLPPQLQGQMAVAISNAYNQYEQQGQGQNQGLGSASSWNADGSNQGPSSPTGTWPNVAFATSMAPASPSGSASAFTLPGSSLTISIPALPSGAPGAPGSPSASSAPSSFMTLLSSGTPPASPTGSAPTGAPIDILSGAPSASPTGVVSSSVSNGTLPASPTGSVSAGAPSGTPFGTSASPTDGSATAAPTDGSATAVLSDSAAPAATPSSMRKRRHTVYERDIIGDILSGKPFTQIADDVISILPSNIATPVSQLLVDIEGGSTAVPTSTSTSSSVVTSPASSSPTPAFSTSFSTVTTIPASYPVLTGSPAPAGNLAASSSTSSSASASTTGQANSALGNLSRNSFVGAATAVASMLLGAFVAF